MYEHVLGGSQHDSDGHPIRSDWASVSMSVLEGLDGEGLPERDPLGNSANPDKIANPDNLKYSEEMRALLIGKDSGNHVNNLLWAYDLDTHQLSRILSSPRAPNPPDCMPWTASTVSAAS